MNPDQIKEKYDEYLDKWHVFEYEDVIRVPLVVVNSEYRGQGIGRKVFEELVNYADQVGKTITLTPTEDWGADKDQLIKFYKSLGFVLNKGKNKNYEYSELMYREPQTATNEAVFTSARFKQLAGLLNG